MKIFLDDIRLPYGDGYGPGWTIIRNYDDFLYTWEVNKKLITHISFDHDLGEGMKTGYDALKLVEEDFILGNIDLFPCMKVHSANPSGRELMELTIQRLYERLEEELDNA